MKNVLTITTEGEQLLANVEAEGTSLIINGSVIDPSLWTGSGTYTTTVAGHEINITKAACSTNNYMLTKTADYTYKFDIVVTGAVAGSVNGSTSIANKSVAGDSSIVNLGSFTLPYGTWLVKIHVRFANNGNGNRTVILSDAPDGDALSVWNVNKVPASPTSYTHVSLITFLRPNYPETTYYVNVQQNSGSNINAVTRWGALKIE